MINSSRGTEFWNRIAYSQQLILSLLQNICETTLTVFPPGRDAIVQGIWKEQVNSQKNKNKKKLFSHFQLLKPFVVKHFLLLASRYCHYKDYLAMFRF